jgi:hypothetical protein
MSRTPFFRNLNHNTGQTSARFGRGGVLTRSHGSIRQRRATLGLLIIITCLTPASVLGQYPLGDPNWRSASVGAPPTSQNEAPKPLTDKQRQILQASLERTRKDAAEMAALAKELREKLDKSNADALSLEVVNLADKIEKLAKKIRGETKGY